MSLWLVTYTGKKRWNFTAAAVVRAPSAEEACDEACMPENECKAELIDPDAHTRVILSRWEGDPG